ncbi:MAG: response regulator [Calditrichaeota bacterium]|nr:response regulator [Calditrichota bacterium]
MGKVLLVDDDPVMQRYTGHILEKGGFEVDTASDAFEAASKARQTSYDLVVVDLVLPGPQNGIDVIREIRKRCPLAKIVAYSGFSDEDILEKVTYAGADHFLRKPFHPNDLLNIITGKSEETKTVNDNFNIQFA